MAAESGELIGACEFMKGEQQPPRILQPSLAPNSSLLLLRPNRCLRLSPGPWCPAAAARALVLSLYYLLPEDPLLPASLSFLRPWFPLQLPRMAFPPGNGTAPVSVRLLHTAAGGDPAPVDFFGLLYPALDRLGFRDTPPVTPPCLFLPSSS